MIIFFGEVVSFSRVIYERKLFSEGLQVKWVRLAAGSATDLRAQPPQINKPRQMAAHRSRRRILAKPKILPYRSLEGPCISILKQLGLRLRTGPGRNFH